MNNLAFVGPFSPRRQTPTVKIGHLSMGSEFPIRVQSMTNTDTADIDLSVHQVIELVEAGSELVRLTVGNEEAAKAIPFIREKLLQKGMSVPLIGDFHFNGHTLLKKYPECAAGLDKYRINPGNVGKGKRRDIQFAEMIEMACQYEKPVRIGVNWGSLDPELLETEVERNRRLSTPLSSEALVGQVVIKSALESADFAESVGLPHDRIILSCKHSDVRSLIEIYRQLAVQCDYPLHVGLTEAGGGTRGIVASVSALSVILADGIGDTIRLSLTPQSGGSRAQEVKVAQELLQSMGFRSFRPTVISCPGCGRTRGDYFQALAGEIETYIDSKLHEWKNTYPGIEKMKVAVMGCVVNGPGESKHADIGISLPGRDEQLGAPVYGNGQRIATLKGPTLVEDMKALLDQYVEANFYAK